MAKSNRSNALERRYVSTKELANHLNITPRRVQQLVAEEIFDDPKMFHHGGYDLDVCRHRYNLKTDGSTREWAQFHELMQCKFDEADRLQDIALKPNVTEKKLQAAIAAVEAAFSDMFFSIACIRGDDRFQGFSREMYRQQRVHVLQGLIWRGFEMLAERYGITPEEVSRQVQADLARNAA